MVSIYFAGHIIQLNSTLSLVYFLDRIENWASIFHFSGINWSTGEYILVATSR